MMGKMKDPNWIRSQRNFYTAPEQLPTRNSEQLMRIKSQLNDLKFRSSGLNNLSINPKGVSSHSTQSVHKFRAELTKSSNNISKLNSDIKDKIKKLQADTLRLKNLASCQSGELATLLMNMTFLKYLYAIRVLDSVVSLRPFTSTSTNFEIVHKNNMIFAPIFDQRDSEQLKIYKLALIIEKLHELKSEIKSLFAEHFGTNFLSNIHLSLSTRFPKPLDGPSDDEKKKADAWWV